MPSFTDYARDKKFTEKMQTRKLETQSSEIFEDNPLSVPVRRPSWNSNVASNIEATTFRDYCDRRRPDPIGFEFEFNLESE